MYLVRRSITALWAALWASVALCAAIPTLAAEHNPVAREPRQPSAASTMDVIVKLRPEVSGPSIQKLSSGTDRNAALARRTGLKLALRREISPVMLATRIEAADGTDQALEALRADDEVEYVSPDRVRYAHATQPSDPLFVGQWYLQTTQVSASNATNAWDREIGSAGVVVAVLDTGVLYDHPDLGRADLGGKLLPGFDFVSNTTRANDGDGRDADASDPGDWVDSEDRSAAGFDNCDIGSSSWHGTRVAGMVGARTDNGSGVAGIAWNSLILPVRVLGKCGGTDSDILAGMRWAAGLRVNGVPDNPTPARILNMSLGSSGGCDASYRDVIQELTARKVLVVISAGNEGTVVSSPANCPGVASVAAIRHAGSKVGFSSLGPEVTIAAPGGNCVNVNGGPCLFSLDTTSNAGARAPGAHIFTDQFNNNLGTSFSAPIVSGVAALMLSRNNNLSTSQMLARLREGARAFPISIAGSPNAPVCHVPVNASDFQLSECLCTRETCGAGMVDAVNSIAAAERPIAAVSLPTSVSPGQDITLNASGSAAACGRTLVSHSWQVISPTSNPPALSGANGPNVTLTAPVFDSLTLRLTVTDDQNRTDTADVIVDPNRARSAAPASAGTSACPVPVTSGPTPGGSTPAPTPSPTPAPTPGFGNTGNRGGGGGGSLGLFTLLMLAFTALRRCTRRA